MNNISKKVFIENATGKRFFVINKAEDKSWGEVYSPYVIIYTSLGVDTEQWYSMNAYYFYQDFVEVVGDDFTEAE